MSTKSESEPLVVEFWIMKKHGRSWEFWEEFPSEKAMLRGLKKFYNDGDDPVVFVSAVVTAERLKP